MTSGGAPGDVELLRRRRDALARALRYWRAFRPLSPYVWKLAEQLRSVDEDLDRIERRRRAS